MESYSKMNVMHVLSVLLDELTKGIWRDSVLCWDLSGDDEPSLMLTLTIYDKHTISLNQITEFILKCGISSYRINFRSVDGVLEISICILSFNASNDA